MDIGEDISVIPVSQRPSRWPKMENITYLQWTDQNQNPKQTSNELYWRDEECQKGTFWSYIVPHLHVNLWDQDVMT